jgi:hypothetical protein
MAAVQEIENSGKAPATSVAVIYTMKRLADRGKRLIKESRRFPSEFRGVLYGQPGPFLGCQADRGNHC